MGIGDSSNTGDLGSTGAAEGRELHADVAPEVVAIVADLLFASRIRGAAAAVGVSARIVRTGPELIRTVQAAPPRLILIDLDARAGDPSTVIAALRAQAGLANVPIVAFGSHVQRDALLAARSAGADRVLARSAFIRELPELLRGTDVADPTAQDSIPDRRRDAHERAEDG